MQKNQEEIVYRKQGRIKHLTTLSISGLEVFGFVKQGQDEASVVRKNNLKERTG